MEGHPCRSRECLAKADHDKLTCEMRCLLYNDFTLCKRHNQKGRGWFLDGHLLLPSFAKDRDNSAALELLQRHRKRLRITGLPEKHLNSSELEKLKAIGEKGFARYLVGTQKTPADVVKALSTGDPHRHFFATGEEAGLCISGYYVPRMAESGILKSIS